jgi:hypothetical protein
LMGGTHRVPDSSEHPAGPHRVTWIKVCKRKIFRVGKKKYTCDNTFERKGAGVKVSDSERTVFGT